MGRRAATLRYRLDVAARLVAATAGGYGIAALIAIAAALALPMARIEAVMAGTIAALLTLPVVAMACFWAKSAARAWGGVALSAAILGGIALASGWRP